MNGQKYESLFQFNTSSAVQLGGRGGREGEGLPCLFLKIEKKCLDFGEKKVLIVFLLGFNFPFFHFKISGCVPVARWHL